MIAKVKEPFRCKRIWPEVPTDRCKRVSTRGPNRSQSRWSRRAPFARGNVEREACAENRVSRARATLSSARPRESGDPALGPRRCGKDDGAGEPGCAGRNGRQTDLLNSQDSTNL